MSEEDKDSLSPTVRLACDQPQDTPNDTTHNTTHDTTHDGTSHTTLEETTPPLEVTEDAIAAPSPHKSPTHATPTVKSNNSPVSASASPNYDPPSVAAVWSEYGTLHTEAQAARRNARSQVWENRSFYLDMDVSDLSVLTDEAGVDDIVLSLQHDIDSGLQTDFEYSYDNPIFLDNLDHKTSDLDFDEVGFAENIEVPEMDSSERTTLLKAINDKIENISGFTDAQRQRVKEVVIENYMRLGRRTVPLEWVN